MSKKNLDSGAAEAGRAEVTLTAAVTLPFGVACAAIRGGRVHSVEWEPTLPQLAAAVSTKYPGSRLGTAKETAPASVLGAYARGAAVAPEEVLALAFEWERLGAFARHVLRELATVPYGARVTYGELAARCGRARAARAVGGALARNPWPILVPCHRVVGAGGRLAGFGKGPQAKRALLAFERGNVGRGGDA